MAHWLIWLFVLVLVTPARASQFTVLLDDDLLPCTIGADRVPKCTPAPPPVYVPPVGPISCPGFDRTITVSAVVPANGTPFVRYYVNTRGGFGADDALVVVFKAPAADPIFQLNVTHTGDQYGPQASRSFTLSTKPCEFSGGLWSSDSTVAALKLRTNADTRYARIQLTPGQTYYLNVTNKPGACVRCDVYVSILNNAP